MTREAEQGETRLKDVMEKLRSQQEQSIWTLDTRIDTMMERLTQVTMDRLDGLLFRQEWIKNRGENSLELNREPRVNFNEHPSRRRT